MRTGLLLVLVGLVLGLDVVQVDPPGVDLVALGWILVFAGVLSLVASIAMARQRPTVTRVDRVRTGRTVLRRR